MKKKNHKRNNDKIIVHFCKIAILIQQREVLHKTFTVKKESIAETG